jgi:hypothetical protein
MAWYLVEIRYVPEKLAEVRPRHREFLSQLVEQGIVALAGPFADNTAGVVLYQAADRDSLQELLDRDPYAVEGVVAERIVREFKPVLGTWIP